MSAADEARRRAQELRDEAVKLDLEARRHDLVERYEPDWASPAGEQVLTYARHEFASGATCNDFAIWDGTQQVGEVHLNAVDAVELATRLLPSATAAHISRVAAMPGAQMLVDTIVHITRQTTWETAQEELDAIYEALRHHGHAV